MNKSAKLRIFKEVRPYFRLLNAYNRDHFRHNNWHEKARSVLVALFTTTMITIVSIHISFDLWNMIDCRDQLAKVVALFPLIIGALQTWISFLAMLMGNRTINVMTDRLQAVVDERNHLFPFIFFEICIMEYS